MFCPYNNNIEQINEWRYEYDENNLETFAEHKLIEKRSFIECKGEKCGAWHNGKCCYNGKAE